MDEVTEEKLEDVKDISIEPLEVKVVNETKKEKSIYDSEEDAEYIDLDITTKQREEFENGDT